MTSPSRGEVALEASGEYPREEFTVRVLSGPSPGEAVLDRRRLTDLMRECARLLMPDFGAASDEEVMEDAQFMDRMIRQAGEGGIGPDRYASLDHLARLVSGRLRQMDKRARAANRRVVELQAQVSEMRSRPRVMRADLVVAAREVRARLDDLERARDQNPTLSESLSGPIEHCRHALARLSEGGIVLTDFNGPDSAPWLEND